MDREKRRQFAIVTGAVLAWPFVARAQRPAKVYRVGWLANAPPTTQEAKRIYSSYTQKFREFGYIEGQNLFIEWRYSEGRNERFADFAAEMVRRNVDVIVAGATPAAQSAQQATQKIPIVFYAVVDPVGAGLVASLAHPGGNITGLSMLSVEVGAKRLEFLREIIPAITRVAILWNPANRSNHLQLERSKETGQKLGMRLHPVEVRDAGDLEAAFQALAREQASGVLVLDDPTLYVHQAKITALATKAHLPIIGGLPGFAEAGGLMAYGTDLTAQVSARVVTYVDKILKGAKPGDLPVEQPMRFELIVNLKTAKILRLKVMPSLLLRADRVIE